VLPRATLATIAGLAVCESLSGTTDGPWKGIAEPNETKWKFSLSAFTYLAQHSRDFCVCCDREVLTHTFALINPDSSKRGPFHQAEIHDFKQ